MFVIVFQCSLDPQIVMGCCNRIWNIVDISTEFSNQWGLIIVAIPHFNEIRSIFLAIYIQGEEGYIDIGPIGLGDEVDAVCQHWVFIWV